MSVATELSPERITDLRARLRGPLLQPEDPGYEDSRTIWNAMIDRRPAAVVRCLGTADVVTCVDFARDNGVPFTIKGGGHNIAGLSVSDGSLMLDMSLMRGVWVDTAARVAHAQAGCLLGDVDRETQLHGLAAVLGFVSNTGIAGLTLGGGFGYLTRGHGWTSDNVRSMTVVTAAGKIVRASESENADLFWGLRGGGGNFGVVTDFEYELYPVGPQVLGGAIAWRGEDTDAVLEKMRELTMDAPPELTMAAVLRKAPPAPWLPAEIHGKDVAVVVACSTGDGQEARKRVAALKAFGKPVGDVVQDRPYVTQQSLLDATQPKGRRYYWKSEYLQGIDPAILPILKEYAADLPSPHSAVILFPLDGPLNSLPDDHSAVGNRTTGAVLNITASWDEAKDDAKNIDWARRAWQAMRKFSTGGTYINFLTEEEGGDRIQAAFGANYERLIDIKTKWDPTNLFRFNKNIAPRG